MKSYIMRSITTVVLFLVVLAVSGCEDEPPTDYVSEPFLEAYLIVDEPIQGIVVANSQPITEAFDYAGMMERNAQVTITTGSDVYSLEYAETDGIGSYRYPDTSVRIKPGTKYAIAVLMPDGKELSAETVTPERISWTIEPREFLQYPQDTTVLFSPDSLRIAWTPGNSIEYIIRVKALDTLGYGQYLEPATTEINERTNNIPFEEPDDPTFYTLTRWGFVQTNQAPTVWAAFRWYGRNEVAILAPDQAMLDWFKATQWGGRSVEYRPEFSNVNGGVGILASASVIEQDVFVLKRKKQ